MNTLTTTLAVGKNATNVDNTLLSEARKTPLTPKERANIISKSSEDVTNDVMNGIDKIPPTKRNFGEIDGKEITREIKSRMDEYYGKYNKSITKRVKQREPIRQKKNMLFDYDGQPVEIISYTKLRDTNYIKVRDYFKGGKITTLTDEGIIKLKPVGLETQEKVMKNGREISIDIFENPFTKQKVKNPYKK